MRIGCTIASGRATCPMCGQKIAEGEVSITIEGYRESVRVHPKCIDTMVEMQQKIMESFVNRRGRSQ